MGNIMNHALSFFLFFLVLLLNSLPALGFLLFGGGRIHPFGHLWVAKVFLNFN
jgi:hypothetical protein